MGITGTVGAYETFYGGIANRIHNVQLVAHLVDHKFIAPGATFSFNDTTGERSAAKGFLEAPVIVNGELQTGLGGGVCQVSTTVFNAAYEAGLPITARTNHALYISHYPLGRDATVDYPGIDLKFVNDTNHWMLLRTYVGSSSLRVVLYGAPQHRRVESVAAPLRTVAAPARPEDGRRHARARPGRRRRLRRAGADDVGRAQGLRAERQAALRRDVVLELPLVAEDHPRRPEAGREEEGAGEADRHDDDHTTTTDDDDYGDDDDGRAAARRSALAIASESHVGTRVGRSVVPSTVACAVHPSAITASSRSIAYS